MKKLLFLFLALLLPVLIFLFLKSLGKNEFAVPVLFADSVTVPVTCGQYAYLAPYTLPDSVLNKFSWNSLDSVSIIVFENSDKSAQHEHDIHINRVFTEFKDEPVHVIRIFKNSALSNSDTEGITNISVSDPDFKVLHDCVFLLGPDNDASIFDRQKRIRGQYNLAKRDDADRMIMQEMNILFKRY